MTSMSVKRFMLLFGIIQVSVASNLILALVAQHLSLPVFLDSTFTILTAAWFGLIPGIITGFLTNLVHEAVSGFDGVKLPFAIVNMTSALITWFAVRRGFLRHATGAFWLLIVLALANAFLGSIIVTTLFSGVTDSQVDNIVRAIVISGQSVLTSAFLARVFINIVDKGIAILILFPLYRKLKG